MAPLDRTEADFARVRAAIAEAGYPPEDVRLRESDGAIGFPMYVPQYVAWKATAVAGVARACWPCNRDRQELGGAAVVCDHPVDPSCPERDQETVVTPDDFIPMTPRQNRHVHALLNQQHPGEDRHKVLSALVGRDITSATQLSDLDAERVIDALDKEANQ